MQRIFRASEALLPLLALCLWARMRMASPVTWDAIQFTLALDQYDVARHLPHPPGYFLYVVLGRLVRLLTHDGWAALILIGGLSGAAAVWLTVRATADVGGQAAAVIAGLLAATCPLVAIDSGQGHTHVPACALSALIGWCAIRLWGLAPCGSWPLPVSSVAIAALAGIRPSDAVLLAPLWLVALRRRGWGSLCAGLALAGVGTAAWVIPMSVAVGGMASFWKTLAMLVSGFVCQRSPVTGDLQWLERNLGDVLLGMVGVLGAGTVLPFLLVHRKGRPPHEVRLLWALWTLPALALFTLLHIGKVYYVLTVAPGLWMMAGMGAARLSRALGTVRSIPLLAALALHALFLGQVHDLRSCMLASWEQAVREVRTLPPSRTVVLAPSVPRGMLSDCDTGAWDFRHAQWYLPEFLTVMFPTDDTATVGRFNLALQRRTLQTPVPVRLRNTEWVVFTDVSALKALPPGVEVAPIRTPKLSLYRLHCDPCAPLVIGPGLRLQCSPR